MIEDIVEFHEAFGRYVGVKPTVDVPEGLRKLREDLILEEWIEYKQADNIVEIADALTDLLYVVLGAMVTHGLQDYIVALFDEVHRSNMSKLNDGNPVYREDGKVMHGPNYTPPDIASVLRG